MRRLLVFLFVVMSIAVSSIASAQGEAEVSSQAHRVYAGTIAGQVLSINSDGETWPLGSYSGWGVEINVFKVNLQTGELGDWVTSSWCEDSEVDQFGYFTISRMCNGDLLPQDDYEVTVNATAHYYRIARVSLGSSAVYLHFELPIFPVYIEVQQEYSEKCPATPSEGATWITLPVRIWNFDTHEKVMEVSAVLYGPTRTQLWGGQHQVSLPSVGIPQKRWGYRDVKLAVNLANGLLGGRRYDAYFRIGPPDGIYGEVTACVIKGGR